MKKEVKTHIYKTFGDYSSHSSQVEYQPPDDDAESTEKTTESFWDIYGNEVEEIESFIKTLPKDLGESPISFKKGETIIDLRKFLDSHLGIMRGTNRIKSALPYLDRLRAFKDHYETRLQ